MQVIFGHYPMTVAQMDAWGRNEVSKLTPKEIGRALGLLERGAIIRRAK